MSTVEYNDHTTQDGYVLPIGAWNDTLSTLQPGTSPGYIGFLFDFSDLSSQCFVRPDQLTLTVAAGGTPTGVTVGVYGIPETDPDPYSDTLLPGSRDEINDDLLLCEVTGDVGAGDFTWTAGSTFTYQLGYRYANGAWNSDATLSANLHRWKASYVLRGSLKFALTHQSSSASGPYFQASETVTVSERPVLQVIQWAQHTGHSGVSLDGGRSLHDMRSGLPALAGELIEDGYQPGIWVRSDWWDPAEDEDRAVNLPDTEGKVRDSVPQ